MDYINIRQILDDLLADDMMEGLSLERAVNYAAEFIRVVGMPNIFSEKVAEVEIDNYRGELPCDFLEEIQVKAKHGPEYLAMESPFLNDSMFAYKIKGHIIFTSVKKDTLCIAYRAYNVDKDGFPLIPDNGTFARALELYIQKRYFTILFNKGKIKQDVLSNIQQEYAFYVGQAQNDLIRPTIDQAQSFTNMWTTLIQRTHRHSDGFATLNMPEVRKF